MAEGTYEYECSRADLLGVNPPSRVDWEAAEEVRRDSQLAEQMTVWDKKNSFSKFCLKIENLSLNLGN